MTAAMSEQRLDKWLWCARLVKTRSGAARAVAEGKVRINGERILKPSRLVHEGDVVTTTASGRLFVVRVFAWTARRGPASLARTLYEDLTPNRGAFARVSSPGEGATAHQAGSTSPRCTAQSEFKALSGRAGVYREAISFQG